MTGVDSGQLMACLKRERDSIEASQHSHSHRRVRVEQAVGQVELAWSKIGACAFTVPASVKGCVGAFNLGYLTFRLAHHVHALSAATSKAVPDRRPSHPPLTSKLLLRTTVLVDECIFEALCWPVTCSRCWSPFARAASVFQPAPALQSTVPLSVGHCHSRPVSQANRQLAAFHTGPPRRPSIIYCSLPAAAACPLHKPHSPHCPALLVRLHTALPTSLLLTGAPDAG
jgi:hypothetical protein